MTLSTQRGEGKPRRWFARQPRTVRMLAAAVAGVLASLGQAPFDQPLVLVLMLTAAFLMMRRQKMALDAGLLGWAFGTGYFCVTLVWIMEPFQVDAARHGWMAPFALAFMGAGMALFWGAAFWIARRVSPRTWPLILTWTLAEVTRAYIFTGFPWASPAQSLVDAIAGQGLAWVGPHGMNLWLFSVAWLLSFPAAFRGRPVITATQILCVIGVTLSLVLAPTRLIVANTPHWVRLIQPNAAQHLKWQPELAQQFYQTQLALTAAPPEGGVPVPSLIVWPETAIPWRLQQAEPALQQIAQSTSAQVALGVLRAQDGRLRNALVTVNTPQTGPQVYDKHHLVPFGEYIPFMALADRLGITGLAANGSGFSAGKGPKLLDFGALGKALPLICYEAVFAHGINAAPKRPDFLLQITNDAWFGQTIGPQQHLAQARMRAIEQGLPLVRAANTGISAVIDPLGRIVAFLELGKAGAVDAALPAPLSATVYNRTGDLPIVLFLLTILLLARAQARRIIQTVK